MARRKNGTNPLTVLARAIGHVISAGILLGIAAGAVGAAIIYWEITESLPPVDRIVKYRPPVVTQVFSDDGTLIAEFFSEKRYLVPLAKIPPVVRNAFVAAEDGDFYLHKGIDPVSIGRAFLSNVTRGGKVQGGSTITQQVVKMLLLSPKKSYERKLKEVMLSLRLEKQLSKDEILQLYLNHIYLGSSAYGVAAAAREYFDKSVEDLNLPEAALLAGLPQAPSDYSPFRNWPLAKARQRYVLNRMYAQGFITRQERDDAAFHPVKLATRKSNFLAAPYFVEHIRQMLEDHYGQTAVYELGLRVQTTVNLKMQQLAEEALRAGLENLSARHQGYRYMFRDMEPKERDRFLNERRAAWKEGMLPLAGESYEAIVTSVRKGSARVQIGPYTGELTADPDSNQPLPELQLNDLIRARVTEVDEHSFRSVLDPSPILEGALVAIEPRTGHVKAMAGGYSFARSQFNRVTQARRQPGSSFKPLIYAAALDNHFTPASVIEDGPISFNDNGRIWSPRNYDGKFHGPVTLRQALTLSLNTVTVRLTSRVGVKTLIPYLNNFGLTGPFAPNLSIALGSAEVTPLELAMAYSVFANGGQRCEPVFISAVTDSHGKLLESHACEPVQAIPPHTAYQMTSMMQDVVRYGTGTKAALENRPVAGKTGTTNDFHDNWFVGYTPNLLAAVWIGFDTKQSIGKKETGGRNAAPIWHAFMEGALEGAPYLEFPLPTGLRCVNVDTSTGERAAPGPHTRLECAPVSPEAPVEDPSQQPPAPPLQQVQAGPPAKPRNTVKDFLRDDL